MPGRAAGLLKIILAVSPFCPPMLISKIQSQHLNHVIHKFIFYATISLFEQTKESIISLHPLKEDLSLSQPHPVPSTMYTSIADSALIVTGFYKFKVVRKE